MLTRKNQNSIENRRGGDGDDDNSTPTSTPPPPPASSSSSSSPSASPRRRKQQQKQQELLYPLSRPSVVVAGASSSADGDEQQQQQQLQQKTKAAGLSPKARDSAFGEQDDVEDEGDGADETAALAATHRRNAAAAAAAAAAAEANASAAPFSFVQQQQQQQQLPLTSGAGGAAETMTGLDNSSAALRTPPAALRVALPGAPAPPSSDELNGVLGERRLLRRLSSFQRALTLAGVLALGVLFVASHTRRSLLVAAGRSARGGVGEKISPFPLYALYFQPPLLASLMLWLWAGCVAWFEASGTRYEACFSPRDRRRLPRSEALARGKIVLKVFFSRPRERGSREVEREKLREKLTALCSLSLFFVTITQPPWPSLCSLL